MLWLYIWFGLLVQLCKTWGQKGRWCAMSFIFGPTPPPTHSYTLCITICITQCVLHNAYYTMVITHTHTFESWEYIENILYCHVRWSLVTARFCSLTALCCCWIKVLCHWHKYYAVGHKYYALALRVSMSLTPFMLPLCNNKMLSSSLVMSDCILAG